MQNNLKLSKPISYLKVNELSTEIYNYGLYLIVRNILTTGLSDAIPQSPNFRIQLKFDHDAFTPYLIKILQDYTKQNESDLRKVKPERLIKAINSHSSSYNITMKTPLTKDSQIVHIELKTRNNFQSLTISSEPYA